MTAIIAAIAGAIVTAIISNIQGRVSERRKLQKQGAITPEYAHEKARSVGKTAAKEVVRVFYPGSDKFTAQFRKQKIKDLGPKLGDFLADQLFPLDPGSRVAGVSAAEKKTPPDPPRERGTPGGVGAEPPRNRGANDR